MSRSRAEVLTSGWLWCSIAVLVMNDHVLKAAHPGWLTGKLSDIAGIAMLAMALAAVAGRRWPVAAVGVGFALVKTVPGAAEAAAPMLGGVTSRDPSDLLALLVLAPVWHWLGSTAQRDVPRAPAVMALVQVTAVFAVVGATSATACGPGTGVADVAYDEGRFRAVIAEEWLSNPVTAWTSRDGRSWDEVEVAGRLDPRTEVSLDDGTTVEVGGQGVEVTAPDGTTSTYVVDQESSYYCAEDPAAPYQSVATDGQVVVVAMGESGVSVRDEDGRWEQVRVGADDSPVALRVASQAGSLVVGLASLVAWAVLTVLSPGRRAAVAVAGTALVAVQAIAVGGVYAAGPSVDGLLLWSGVSVVAWTCVTAVVLMVRRARTR